MKGKIILINGPSSSGKSTLAAALLQFKQYQFAHLSIDRQMDSGFATLVATYPRLFEVVAANGASGKTGARLDPKPFFRPVTEIFHRVVVAHSAAGINVVVDHLLLDKEAIMDCLALFDPEVVTTVGLYCPIDELERREHERADRSPGTARSQIDIHKGWLYDFKIDSQKSWVADYAPRIIEMIDKCSAFAKMKQIYQKGPVDSARPAFDK